MNNLQFAAMVAYPANDQPSLCELPGGPGIFQPEIKKVDDLWFASTGSGQSITDPFLALLRKVYWRDEAPSLQGGIFTALWALQHACEVSRWRWSRRSARARTRVSVSSRPSSMPIAWRRNS